MRASELQGTKRKSKHVRDGLRHVPGAVTACRTLYLLPLQLKCLLRTVADMQEPNQQDSVLGNNEAKLPKSCVRLCRAICTSQGLEFER